MTATETRHAWWASLKHGGLLIAPSKLAEFFPDEPKPLPSYLAEQLRRDLTKLETGTAEAERALLDTVLEQVCELGVRWEKGSHVDTRWSYRASTGEAIKPRRVWYGPHEAILAVFVSDESRVGIGRGRRDASRVVEWLRQSGQKVAVLTNGRQWRLIHAGLDYEAFAEWDISLWFEEGQPGPQVVALQALLSASALTPAQPGESAPLIAAILASRRGQAELSAELGERVRRAVERLIQAHGPALEALGEGVTSREIYLAATRVIMRMVVVLFAEARDLLPRENPIYHASYGLQGLRELLDRFTGAAATERLRYRYGAWPRILGLFRLVYEGSHHQALPVPRYGGGLFASGSSTAAEPIQRALAVFENAHHDHMPSDAVVQEILGLLCRSRVKVRQGQGSTWVDAPVDFSDLSSEYIGILYEGLLDYELRRVEADNPIVFLRLGDEPALPLSRLETMDDRALGNLVSKLKVKKKTVASSGEDGEGEESEEDEEQPEEDEREEEGPALEETVEADALETGDAHQQARERAKAWARKAVIAGKLVKRPSGGGVAAQQAYEATVTQTAEALIARVVLPGEWFLVRWGGTRKGSGTFYTRPQLAVPTVQRTLRPLAYDPPVGDGSEPNEMAAPHRWSPKKPESILALKVCDPGMGSGSFLVASLRFLTDALFASLHVHGRIRSEGDQSLVTLAEGQPAQGTLTEELLPCRPDSPDFEPRLRARLKRYVVERCIYGVDLDPLAVELARLSLWVETMDRDLPFEFLDHKLKRGNSLVGCWFDRFRDYPVLAWNREGGDKNHTNGVHSEKEAWTKAIKQMRNGRVKQELAAWITGQRSMLDEVEGHSPEVVHDEALAAFERLHGMPVHETDERARFYQEHILNNPALKKLKAAFDTWCAIWFWPADCLDDAPTPRVFENPPESTRRVVSELANEHRFFHWELEFPDVFAVTGGGFDALMGNPPWEIQKPNSKEYFSNLDPLYRTYGKQEALAKQRELFETRREDERAWLQYIARLKALGNFGKHAAAPFGDGDDADDRFSFGRGSAALHHTWNERRAKRCGYGDAAHPFQHQGSADINTYKLFLEQSHALLRPGGQLGMLVPSGIYTDKGSTALRSLFLNKSRWKWLFALENREKVFDIDSRFKFGPIILEKGGTTHAIQTAFMRRNLNDWEQAEQFAIPYARTQVEQFSPNTRAILEIRNRRDLQILEKIYANSVLLGGQGQEGWNLEYVTEFHMTNDSKLFPPRPKWEEEGYRPDEYGRWIGPEGDVALPLYEGRMIGQFDFSEKGWVSGKGRSAVWRDISWDAKVLEPQYLMAQDVFRDTLTQSYLEAFGETHGEEAIEEERERLTDFQYWWSRVWKSRRSRPTFMDIGSATNKRTTIASFIYGLPCGNKVPILYTAREEHALALIALLNSYSYDFQMRARLGGLTLNYFIISETALIPLTNLTLSALVSNARRLSLVHQLFSPFWLVNSVSDQFLQRRPWKQWWAVSRFERLRLRCLLDAIAAELFGLDCDDLAWVLRDCDYPVERMGDKSFTRTLDPKGFWRVDKELDPELRHTVLSLVAFHDLKQTIAAQGGNREAGIEAFCNQNDGDGWMLPETVRLDDFGLGHDARAKEPQPVRSRLGDRFLSWQLEQSVEESWAECERHARNILGEAGFAQLQMELRGEVIPATAGTSSLSGENGMPPYEEQRLTLFGDVEPSGSKKRQKR